MAIRATSKAPPPAPYDRERALKTRQRAAAARRILERGEWVTDRDAFGNRNSACKAVDRMKDALVELEGFERADLTQRVRLTRDGWRWWLILKDRLPQRRATAQAQTATDTR